MIVVSEIRCSDCLNEFSDGAKFAVIKEDKSQAYSTEERLLGGHLYHVFVCLDCAGWYDDPVRVSTVKDGE
jgi:hypothetical protein